MSTLPRSSSPARRAGVIALVIAIGAIVICCALRIVASLTTLSGLSEIGSVADSGLSTAVVIAGLIGGSLWGLLATVAYLGLGLWALGQGIYAAVTNRGRTPGIVAIALSLVGIIIVFVLVPLATTSIWLAITA